MSLSVYERDTSIRLINTFQSGSTNFDPSGNMAYIDVIKSDGTYLYTAGSRSGSRSDTGKYYAWVSTQSTDPLGNYTVDWYGVFEHSVHGWTNEHDKTEIRIRYVD